MIGLGTILNVLAIVTGGLIGLGFGRYMKERFQETLLASLAVCTIFIGAGGTLSKMLVVNAAGTGLETRGSMMMILSMVAGAITGEWINLDLRFEDFGRWLKEKSGSQNDSRFINGFVTASLTVCIGAMAIIGSIQDGIYGDYSILAAKSILDFTIIIIMAASMGKGVVFSAVPVGILQGSITLLARLIEPLMTEAALSNISYVGNILIACVGLNLLRPKTIRVANLLPALVFSVICAFLPWF